LRRRIGVNITRRIVQGFLAPITLNEQQDVSSRKHEPPKEPVPLPVQEPAHVVDESPPVLQPKRESSPVAKDYDTDSIMEDDCSEDDSSIRGYMKGGFADENTVGAMDDINEAESAVVRSSTSAALLPFYLMIVS
jgi:hypothetical protein